MRTQGAEMIKGHVPMKLPGMKRSWLTLAMSWLIGAVAVQIACLADNLLTAWLWVDL